MTTGERLLEISTLRTGSALDHFLNIETGGSGEDKVIRVYDTYKVLYVDPETLGLAYNKEVTVPVMYVSPDKFLITYILPMAYVNVLYVPTEPVRMAYVPTVPIVVTVMLKDPMIITYIKPCED